MDGEKGQKWLDCICLPKPVPEISYIVQGGLTKLNMRSALPYKLGKQFVGLSDRCPKAMDLPLY